MVASERIRGEQEGGSFSKGAAGPKPSGKNVRVVGPAEARVAIGEGAKGPSGTATPDGPRGTTRDLASHPGIRLCAQQHHSMRFTMKSDTPKKVTPHHVNGSFWLLCLG